MSKQAGAQSDEKDGRACRDNRERRRLERVKPRIDRLTEHEAGPNHQNAPHGRRDRIQQHKSPGADVGGRYGKTYEVGVDAKTGKVLENGAEGPNPD